MQEAEYDLNRDAPVWVAVTSTMRRYCDLAIACETASMTSTGLQTQRGRSPGHLQNGPLPALRSRSFLCHGESALPCSPAPHSSAAPKETEPRCVTRQHVQNPLCLVKRCHGIVKCLDIVAGHARSGLALPQEGEVVLHPKDTIGHRNLLSNLSCYVSYLRPRLNTRSQNHPSRSIFVFDPWRARQREQLQPSTPFQGTLRWELHNGATCDNRPTMDGAMPGDFL